jgi:hypothetical protein
MYANSSPFYLASSTTTFMPHSMNQPNYAAPGISPSVFHIPHPSNPPRSVTPHVSPLAAFAQESMSSPTTTMLLKIIQHLFASSLIHRANLKLLLKHLERTHIIKPPRIYQP